MRAPDIAMVVTSSTMVVALILFGLQVTGLKIANRTKTFRVLKGSHSIR
jgi:hypothetical protein